MPNTDEFQYEKCPIQQHTDRKPSGRQMAGNETGIKFISLNDGIFPKQKKLYKEKRHLGIDGERASHEPCFVSHTYA